MNKVEAFKNELRNYHYYKIEYKRLAQIYQEESKLLGEDNVKKRYAYLKDFGDKVLDETYYKLEETWNTLVGVGAIRYDAIHVSVSQEQRDKSTIALIEKYHMLLTKIQVNLESAELILIEEMNRVSRNVKRIEDVLSRIPNNIAKACVEIYCNGKTYEDISNGNNVFWSASGLYKNVLSELGKVLNNEKD